MVPRIAVAVLLLALLPACGTRRVVRLDTGQDRPIVHLARTEAASVDLDEEEVEQAVSMQVRGLRPSVNPEQVAREQFQVSERSGWYGFSKRQGLTSQEGQPLVSGLPPVDAELTRLYRLWCERRGTPGDCLKLLVNHPVISEDGRYTLGMAFAMDQVMAEMVGAFKELADPEAIQATLRWTMTLYMVLWTVPEPVSKGVAAVLTATLIAYIGVDSVWSLIDGWKRLVEEVNRATTFSEIREAGERYAKVMGRNVARAFVLLASAAVGQTAAGFATKVPRLPNAAQASVVAEAQAGFRLSGVVQVEAVALSAGAVSLTLAPTAVAMRGKDAASGGAASALETAEAGGRHAGFLKNYEGKPADELRRGIDSLKKQIAEHRDKISNPGKYIPGWASLDPRQQKALTDKKWPADIQRQTEQLEILEGLLKRAERSHPQ